MFLQQFERFGKTSGLEDLVLYVSVKYDGFGVVREFSALLSILVFLGLKLMKNFCFCIRSIASALNVLGSSEQLGRRGSPALGLGAE